MESDTVLKLIGIVLFIALVLIVSIPLMQMGLNFMGSAFCSESVVLRSDFNNLFVGGGVGALGRALIPDKFFNLIPLMCRVDLEYLSEDSPEQVLAEKIIDCYSKFGSGELNGLFPYSSITCSILVYDVPVDAEHEIDMMEVYSLLINNTGFIDEWDYDNKRLDYDNSFRFCTSPLYQLNMFSNMGDGNVCIGTVDEFDNLIGDNCTSYFDIGQYSEWNIESLSIDTRNSCFSLREFVLNGWQMDLTNPVGSDDETDYDIKTACKDLCRRDCEYSFDDYEPYSECLESCSNSCDDNCYRNYDFSLNYDIACAVGYATGEQCEKITNIEDLVINGDFESGDLTGFVNNQEQINDLGLYVDISVTQDIIPELTNVAKIDYPYNEGYSVVGRLAQSFTGYSGGIVSFDYSVEDNTTLYVNFDFVNNNEMGYVLSFGDLSFEDFSLQESSVSGYYTDANGNPVRVITSNIGWNSLTVNPIEDYNTAKQLNSDFSSFNLIFNVYNIALIDNLVVENEYEDLVCDDYSGVFDYSDELTKLFAPLNGEVSTTDFESSTKLRRGTFYIRFYDYADWIQQLTTKDWHLFPEVNNYILLLGNIMGEGGHSLDITAEGISKKHDYIVVGYVPYVPENIAYPDVFTTPDTGVILLT